MHDDKTEHLKLPLPHADNTLDQDLPRLRKSFEMLDAEVHGLKENDGTAEKLEAFTSDLVRYKAGIAEQLATYKDASNKDIATFSAGYAKALSDQAAVAERSIKAHTREILKQNLTLHVRPDGSDSNDGSANTPEKALLTVAGALKKLTSSFTVAGQAVYISLAPGTYNESVAITGAHTDGLLRLNIVSADPVNRAVISYPHRDWQNILSASYGARVMCRDIDFNGYLQSLYGSILECQRCNFRVTNGISDQLIYAQALYGSALTIASPATFSGDVQHALRIQFGSICQLVSGEVGSKFALIDNPSVGVMAAVTHKSLLYSLYPTEFTGASRGSRYYVAQQSQIQSYGGGPNWLPGTSAGHVDSTSIYE